MQDWLVPNISSNPLTGLGNKSIADIVTFLKQGAQKTMGIAFGPMGEVVHDSLRFATDADLQAIAVYLKKGPDQPARIPMAVDSPVTFRHDQRLYLENCAQCHQDKGRGTPGMVPNLAGTESARAFDCPKVGSAIVRGAVATATEAEAAKRRVVCVSRARIASLNSDVGPVNTSGQGRAPGLTRYGGTEYHQDNVSRRAALRRGRRAQASVR